MLENIEMFENAEMFEIAEMQGGRSCAKARRAFAEKFGLGRKFYALTWTLFGCDIKIC